MADLDLLKYLETFISHERKEKFKRILENRTRYLTIAAEDVFQMHNVSALIRSCEIFGLQDAHVVEGRYGRRLDKNISMGAQQWVDIHRYRTGSECIDGLRRKGYSIIATTPHNDSCLLPDFKMVDRTALFFGTEKEGLSPEILEGADGYLKIPMVGFTDSLNVSVSAAILLQHLTTALRRSDLKWQLTETEILEKRLDWTKKSIKSIDKILDIYYRKL
jgi:tRNA (guanosine-2'-O-)-methyltransferase